MNDPKVKDLKVISRHPDGTPHEFYYRMKFTGMSDRDCVLRFERNELDIGRICFVKSIDHPDYPPSKKVIRFGLYTANHLY